MRPFLVWGSPSPAPAWFSIMLRTKRWSVRSVWQRRLRSPTTCFACPKPMRSKGSFAFATGCGPKLPLSRQHDDRDVSRLLPRARGASAATQPRCLSRWTNLANGDHEECSFVSARDADKNPASTHYSEKEIEDEGDFIGCGHSRIAGLTGDGATRAAPEHPAAEHPERRTRFRRPLRD